eukprot:COSAG01_NODE_5119_length_4472_cov_20.726961_3_plen_157_part_00
MALIDQWYPELKGVPCGVEEVSTALETSETPWSYRQPERRKKPSAQPNTASMDNGRAANEVTVGGDTAVATADSCHMCQDTVGLIEHHSCTSCALGDWKVCRACESCLPGCPFCFGPYAMPACGKDIATDQRDRNMVTKAVQIALVALGQCNMTLN